MDWLLLAQAINLIGCNLYYLALAILSLPSLLLYYVGFRKGTGADDAPNSATFYEGEVLHIRRAPVRNQFRYAVRMAVLDLENPPSWFKPQAKDHMTAAEARKFAGTSGPVKLLTDPISAGYTQNPISVYYCYSGGSSGSSDSDVGASGVSQRRLERCIAEVSNTPWNERVTFVFNPDGQSVRKALHVSPFMDMQNTWHLEAPEPSEQLKLVVRASHPEHGDYFYADLVARRCSEGAQRVSEEAGLGTLMRFGFMPHRVALLIYWQAVKLLVKGVPFYPPPTKAYQRELLLLQGQGQEERERANPADKAATAAAASAAAAAAVANGGDQVNGTGNGSSNGHSGGVARGGGGGGGGGMCPVAAVSWGKTEEGAGGHTHPRNGANGQHFLWRAAPSWPWREG